MKKLLVTYFEPFGGEAHNTSASVAQFLPEKIGNFEIEKLLLPVEFGRAADIAVKKAEKICADAVISFGQAGGRSVVTPEMVALNLRYASIPDNAGAKPQDEPVVSCAENALFATLPVREMEESLKAAGVPGAVSYSAGTYVCNDLYFRILHHFKGKNVRAAFVHVPLESETLTARMMAEAAEKMIENLQ